MNKKIVIIGLFFLLTLSESLATTSKNNNGIGLNKISDWSTQYPFIDLMKQARAWQDFSNKSSSINVDNNDWVKSLAVDQTATTVFSSVDEKYETYLKRAYVFYEGEGEIKYGGGVKKITLESIPGRDVITLQSGNHLLSITKTNPANYIKNIKIIPFRFFSDFQTGHIFNTDFINKIESINVFRFMDWMNTNNSNQGDWEDRPLIDDRTWRVKGVPLEVMLKLANDTNTAPWFNIPHLANDIYIKNFAVIVKNQLYKNLAIYVEHSNEVWNWQFAQAKYAAKAKFKHSFFTNKSNLRLQWHGMRTTQICNVFKGDVFVTESSRVKCVLGMQTVALAHHKSTLECPAWADRGAGCYQNIDYIGITTYFDGGLNGSRSKNEKHNDIVRTWASNGSAGVNNAFEQLFKGNKLREIAGYEDNQGVLADIALYTHQWSKIAAKYKMGLIAYEGGQHIAPISNVFINDPVIRDFYLNINRDVRMGTLYSDLLDRWHENGGGLHMFYLDISPPSKLGNWGALEHISQKNSAKWKVIKSH
ncbi:hypothetical protein [Colwellia sp. Bg11-28]|uniref:hypothetical protein n=1 Tax=Colwellia sp. Bg11-28 TaxID=2058305 RepID=UPI000C33DE1F|nr:hypothetical protein [Colwellia sp. Bg11-28]PKH85165.1 hypothetical protein CXF79_17945 [Colwellia sp. Bg11-28]